MFGFHFFIWCLPESSFPSAACHYPFWLFCVSLLEVGCSWVFYHGANFHLDSDGWYDLKLSYLELEALLGSVLRYSSLLSRSFQQFSSCHVRVGNRTEFIISTERLLTKVSHKWMVVHPAASQWHLPGSFFKLVLQMHTSLKTICWTLTPRFLTAFRRRLTTSCPSTPLILKPLVQDTKTLWI